jgi:hypothetical protein
MTPLSVLPLTAGMSQDKDSEECPWVIPRRLCRARTSSSSASRGGGRQPQQHQMERKERHLFSLESAKGKREEWF